MMLGGNAIYLFNNSNEKFFVVFEGDGRYFFLVDSPEAFLPRHIHIQGGPDHCNWYDDNCKEDVHSFECGIAHGIKNTAVKELDVEDQAVLEQVLYDIHKYDLDKDAILAKEFSSYEGPETFIKEISKEEYQKMADKDISTVNKMISEVVHLAKTKAEQ